MRNSNRTSTAIPRFVIADPDLQHPSAGCSIHRALYPQEKFFFGGRRKNYLFPRTSALKNRWRKAINHPDFKLVDTGDTKV